MAISQLELEREIKALFERESKEEGDQAASIERVSHGLAEAIARQIKQGIDTATITHALTSESGEQITGEITINTSIEDE